MNNQYTKQKLQPEMKVGRIWDVCGDLGQEREGDNPPLNFLSAIDKYEHSCGESSK
jgi:hypothetical protein